MYFVDRKRKSGKTMKLEKLSYGLQQKIAIEQNQIDN